MADAFRRILYPAFVLTIIATVWAMGVANAKADEARRRRYWPAANPELFRFVNEPEAAQVTVSVLDAETDTTSTVH